MMRQSAHQPSRGQPPGANLATLGEAIARHKAGLLDEAEALYRACLAVSPDDPEARYYLAGLLQQRGDHEAAIDLLQPLLLPESAAALPAALMPQGWLNLGVSLKTLDRLDEAVAAFEQALQRHPAYAGAAYNLGVVLGLQRKHLAAADALNRAIRLRPQHANSHASLGAAYAGLRRFDEALRASEQALALQPGLLAALRTRASVLWQLQRMPEALEASGRALAVAPDDHESLSIRAHVLLSLERYDDILAWTQSRIAQQPDDPSALSFQGAAYSSLQRPEEAIRYCDLALALRPDNALALVSKAHALTCLGRDEEALPCLEAAQAAEPEDAIPEFNRALNLLALGRYSSATWQAYEARWRTPMAEPPRHPQVPRWTGAQDLNGKTLLVWTEQGFGDTIQFCRLFHALHERGARLVVEASPPLVKLLQASFAQASVVAQGTTPLPACDFEVPLMSLPGLLDLQVATIPSTVPYLSADPATHQRWAALVAQRAGAGRQRIGLACSGNVGRAMLRSRAIPLQAFAPLWAENDVFLLQKDLRPEDADTLSQSPVHDLRAEMTDFNDTAALIEALDLVVSVDTAAAHLAGALGKPLHVLLPVAADWRWMRERRDSPWYPGARLYRQLDVGDWTRPLDELIRTLREDPGA